MCETSGPVAIPCLKRQNVRFYLKQMEEQSIAAFELALKGQSLFLASVAKENASVTVR